MTNLDEDKIKELFEDKYEDSLGMSYQDWMAQGPQNEEEAYARLQEIDDELKSTEDQWYDAEGSEKEELEETRQRLKSEYDLVEAAFNLEAPDKNW